MYVASFPKYISYQIELKTDLIILAIIEAISVTTMYAHLYIFAIG